MDVPFLPTLNAVLNGTSAVLMVVGRRYIRRGDRVRHMRCMIAAVVTSTLFLVSYLYYHAHAGSVRFVGPQPIRAVYLAILFTHTVLAAVVPFFVFTALWQGWTDRIASHRRTARWTYPIWLYVSITGVVIYLMLYQLAPRL